MQLQKIAVKSLKAFDGVVFLFEIKEYQQAILLLKTGLLAFQLETIGEDWTNIEWHKKLDDYLLADQPLPNQNDLFRSNMAVAVFRKLYKEIDNLNNSVFDKDDELQLTFSFLYNQVVDKVNAFTLDNVLEYIGQEEAYYYNRIEHYKTEIESLENKYQCSLEKFEEESDSKEEQPLSDLNVIDQWENAISQHEYFSLKLSELANKG